MSLVSDSADFSATGVAARPHAEPSMAGVGDFVALMKPRVMSLVVFTALVGLLVAPGHVHPVIGFTALLCIAIGAGADRDAKRSEEHTSELQSRFDLVCRLLLEKKKNTELYSLLHLMIPSCYCLRCI